MPDFDKYIDRLGECGVQAIIERIERYEGIRTDLEAPLPLEDRWNAVMRNGPNACPAIAT
jgi:hypothetical protein